MRSVIEDGCSIGWCVCCTIAIDASIGRHTRSFAEGPFSMQVIMNSLTDFRNALLVTIHV